MPPLEPKSPNNDFFERGRQLFQDAENSSDPELRKLRIISAKMYFHLDLKGGTRVSPRQAMRVGIGVALLFVGVCVYVVMKLSGATAAFVLLVCLLFLLIIILTLLALCGILGDTVVAEVFSGMYDKTLGKIGKTDTNAGD